MSNKVVMYEDDSIIAIYQKGKSAYLLVTFGDLIALANGTRFYADNPVTKLDISCVGFMAKQLNWFPYESIEKSQESVKFIASNFDSLVTYGGSMGGYAAIKYSGLLGAQHVMAFCPQWSIDPEECEENDKRYINYFQKIMKKMGIKHSDIAGAASIFYDPKCNEDRFHFEKIRTLHTDCLDVKVHSVDHYVTSVLASTSNLKSLISGVVNRDVKSVLGVVHTTRRKSPHRRRVVLNRAVDRHPNLTFSALQALDRAGCNPFTSNDRIYRKLSDALLQRGDSDRVREVEDRLVAASNDSRVPQVPSPSLLRDKSVEGQPVPTDADVRGSANPVQLMELGRAEQRAGRRAEALACFERALALDPAHSLARLSAANMLSELGRSEEAESGYRAVLDLEPDQPRALIGLGRVARRRGDREAALSRFEAAALAAPKDPAPRAEAADVLRELDRLDEAEAHYQAALGLDPRNFRSLLGLGRMARQRGDRAAALARFEAAAGAAPKDAAPRLEAADLLRELGRLEEAENRYRGLLDLDHRNTRALLCLGRIARQRGDRAAARRRFEQAAAIDPAAVGARLELATECRDLGDFDAARRAVEGVLDRAPDEFNAWVNLAQTERRAGQREAALAAFERAVEINPGYSQGLAEMAAEERALGRPFNAERLLARALEADPENAVALLQLGDQARLSDDLPAALRWFERAVAAAPAHVGAMLKASQALADLGRFDDAMAMLRAWEAEHGPSPETLGKQAHLLGKAGDWDAARLLLRRASDAAPRSFPVWAQRAQLELRSGDHAALAEMLREPPARTTHDAAAVQQLHGHLAEARWKFDEAIGHYEHAARLNPNDSGPHLSLARVRLLTLDLAGCREHLAAQARLGRSKALLQGRSGNPSQTHIGQLLDEFALDREGLALIGAARRLAPAERVERLLALVRRAPDYTPAAISLLIAIRQAGAFAAEPRRGGPASPIPDAIAQYWDSPEVPAEVARLGATWREQNPGFAHRWFDDAAATAFLERNYAPDVLRAYRRAREPARRADLFRLALLFAEGGYYADADDRCGAPLSTVVPRRARLALYQEEYGTVGNNFMGAVPGHPAIGLALDLAVEAIARDDRDILWLSTGPGLLTRALARTLAGSRLDWRRWLDGMLVLERGELARAVRVHCACAYKQTDRHWSRTAFGGAAKRGERREGAALAGSV